MDIDASQLKSVRLIAETGELIVVNKPCGLSVHGGADQDALTLIDVLRKASKNPKSILPVHRLDRATSGVVIFAKTAQKAKALSQTWAQVQKTYLAFVFGHWKGPPELRHPIDGKPATTMILNCEHFGQQYPYSLLTIRLVTGRTHQIRKHLQAEGVSVVMDDKYGDFKANKKFKRDLRDFAISTPRKGLFLHSYALKTGPKEKTWIAPVPPIWGLALKTLCETDTDLFLTPKVV